MAEKFVLKNVDGSDPSSIVGIGNGDHAYDMLTGVFGTGWDQLFTGGGGTGVAGDGWSALFQMMGYMNSVVMSGVAVMVFYILSIGVIGTASEGQALGKRYSTLWTPIRSAFSVSMLMPLPGAGGVSLLQASLLLMVSMGSIGANQLWSNGLDFIENSGGTLTLSDGIDSSAAIMDVSRTMMASAIAQNYLAKESGSTSGSYSLVFVPSDSSVTTGVKRGAHHYTMTAPPVFSRLEGKLGTIKINCVRQDSSLCNVKKKLFTSYYPKFYAVGAKIVNGELISSTDKVLISTFVNDWELQVSEKIKSNLYGSESSTAYQDSVKEFVARGKDRGWVSAGSFYWLMAGLQNKLNQHQGLPPGYTSVNLTAISESGLDRYSEVHGLLDHYMGQAVSNISDQALASSFSNRYNSGGDGDDLWSKVLYLTRNWGIDTVNGMTQSLTTGDPILNLKTYGDWTISLMGTTFAAGALSIAALKGAKSTIWSDVVDKASGVGTFTSTLGSIAFALLMALITPLFTAALALAYYLPSVPFILWTMGVIGWFILIIESLVAAPIWAAAHAFPEGEGMAGQHGRQGYMLFMNVLMRPSLMVFGFFASFATMKVAAWLIGKTFETYVAGVTADNEVIGPITVVALISIMTMLMIQAAHRIFGLITYLPEHVMRWVGGSGSQLGEEHDSSAIKMAMGATAGVAASGAGSGGKALSGQVAQNKQSENAAKAEARDDKHRNELMSGLSQQQSDGGTEDKSGSGVN